MFHQTTPVGGDERRYLLLFSVIFSRSLNVIEGGGQELSVSGQVPSSNLINQKIRLNTKKRIVPNGMEYRFTVCHTCPSHASLV